MNFTILIQKTVVMISMQRNPSVNGAGTAFTVPTVFWQDIRIYIIMEILGFREHFCLNVWNIIKPAEYKKFVIVHSVQAVNSDKDFITACMKST